MSSPTEPNLPVDPRATNTTLEFYWNPPSSSGNSAISSYTLACTNVAVGPFSYPVGTNYARITGLTNGTFYDFNISATNVNELTGPSSNYIPFAPGSSVPNPPISTIATALGTNSAIVSWSPPAVLPDSPINWYVIKSSSSSQSDPVLEATADGQTQRSYFFTGLNSNSQYSFSIEAVNCPGYSANVFTSSIGWQVVPDYVWAQNFTTASNGFVNYNVANLIANTPSGTGTSYRTTDQSNLFIPITISATNTVSYCASVYMSNNNVGFAGIIFSRDDSPSCGLNIKGTGTQVGYHWNNVFATYDYNTGIFLTLNTWTHIVLRITSSNAQWYINGNLSNTFVNSHSAVSLVKTTIGSGDPLGSRNFPGYVDNCRFYTRALSQSEITAIYQNTLVT